MDTSPVEKFCTVLPSVVFSAPTKRLADTPVALVGKKQKKTQGNYYIFQKEKEREKKKKKIQISLTVHRVLQFMSNPHTLCRQIKRKAAIIPSTSYEDEN